MKSSTSTSISGGTRQPELWACTLDLLCTSGLRPDIGQQRQVHATFLRWLQVADPPLTDELHRANVLRPFTVSRLPDRTLSNGQTRDAMPTIRLRCTMLHPRIFHAFVQRCLPGQAPTEWRFNESVFTLLNVTFVSTSGWTGMSNFSDLLSNAQTQRTLRVEFATPTAFSMGDGLRKDHRAALPIPPVNSDSTVGQEDEAVEPTTDVAAVAKLVEQTHRVEDVNHVPSPTYRKHIELFPQPGLVWESWARKWNALAPEGLAIDSHTLSQATSRVLVADYNLRTSTLDYGRFPQKGFVGWVRYEMRDVAEAHLKHMHALADFAFYSGTGYKTAMGMGQTRKCT